MKDPTTEEHAIVVAPEHAGGRLDVTLAQCLPQHSRSALQRLIEEGEVTVDGAPARARDKVRPGQRIAVRIPPPRPTELTPAAMDLRILWEDAHLWVIDKPAGLTVHPAPSVSEPTLVNGLLALEGDLKGVGGEDRPGIVHRLDKGTSGVMVVAKDDAAHRGLVELFKVHDIERRYLALVRGAPPSLTGTWTSEIGRNPNNRLKMASVPKGGRRAVTRWRILARWDGASLLELGLETGRTHQIRVHTSEAGCPVLGDPVYAPSAARSLDRHPSVRDALASVDHQLLHAAVLGFVHPVTGERLRFERPPPADFLTVQRALEGTREAS